MEDLFTYSESWKNNAVFNKQLELNKRELLNYPPHWVEFVNILKSLGSKNILDLGCGVGAMSELCKSNIPGIRYTGVDYSDDAIRIARTEWPDNEWFVMSYESLNEEFCKQFDTLHAGAFLDVLCNGDEVLDLLLSLDVRNVLIGRAKVTEKNSYYTTYKAYDEITTYAYHHNLDNLKSLSDKHGYSLVIKGSPNQCSLIFQKSQ